MKGIKRFLKNSCIYYPASIAKMTIKAKDLSLILYALFARIKKIDEKKIVFSSFHGKQYNAQPKLISDELLKRAEKDIDIVWIAPDMLIKDERIRVVPPHSKEAVHELLTAKMWVDNCRKPYWIKKRKGQYYIQTWHGPVCLKNVEKDAVNLLPPYYVKSAIQDSKNADFIVAECSWRRENIKRAFWFDKEIIEGEFVSPIALNDIEAREKVLSFFAIPPEKKILTYVPTFRNSGTTDCYLNEYDILREQLSLESEWVIIVRLHPNIAEKSNTISYSDYVLDGTSYPSADELIKASDMVVTDYSGCIFDGMRYGKKVVLYAKDIESYIKEDRGFYFDLRKMPPPLTQELNELVDTILRYDWGKYELEREKFIKDLGFYNNDASIACVNIIQKLVKGDK